LHNTILQYDGLDTIGNTDEDNGTNEDHEHSDDDFDMEDDTHMEGVEDVEDETIHVEQEVQVGYEDKKSRLWVHFKYACDRGEIRWLKRASVSRPMSLRNPLGALWPWIVDALA
jgi:hypothetical protein